MHKRTFGYKKTRQIENLEAGLFIGMYFIIIAALAVQELVK